MTSSSTPTLARVLTDAGTFRDAPFTFIDVGCSGGLLEEATEFGAALRAVGFDPLIAEIDRLNATATGDVQFQAALVGELDWTTPRHRQTPGVFVRSSANAYTSIHQINHAERYYNSGEELHTTTKRLRLDDWLSERSTWTVDWLKTDTDTNDISVLRSLGARLSEPLAISIEAQFDMDAGEDNDSFANTFRLLVNAGFRLFDLRPTRYSRAAFPQPFEWEMPAQTVRGQVLQADALFCRDLAVEGADSPLRVLKLACIFDLHELQDCAVEVLEEHAEGVARVSPVPLQALYEALGRRTPMGTPPQQSRSLLGEDPCPLMPARANSGALIPAADAWASPGPLPELLPLPELREGGPELAIGTDDGRLSSLLLEGWHEAEGDGVWTAQAHASLQMHIPFEIAAGASFVLTGWTLSDDASATVALAANDALLAPEGYHDGAFRFTASEAIESGALRLTVYALPLLRPCNVRSSSDTRYVGMRVTALRVVPPGGSI